MSTRPRSKYGRKKDYLVRHGGSGRDYPFPKPWAGAHVSHEIPRVRDLVLDPRGSGSDSTRLALEEEERRQRRRDRDGDIFRPQRGREAA